MSFNFDSLKDLIIAVVGDMIVDHYRVLIPKRISSEAPVIIFQPASSEWLPGGAGNVASNLMALGVGQVILGGVVGDDWDDVNPYRHGPSPMPHLALLKEHGRRTTVKERLITNRQQLARIDIQSNREISEASGDAFLTMIEPLIMCADVVVCSDYDHGAMIPGLVSKIMQLCASCSKPVVVDSKSKNLNKYHGAMIALPNNVEAEMMTNLYGHPREVVAKRIMEEMGLKAIGMTLGPEGILLMQEDGPPRIFPPLDPNEQVMDVTGAGDTVTAAVAVGIGLGMTYDQLMSFSNIAAGIVVQKRGVATAGIDEIQAAALSHGIDIGDVK